MASRGAAVDGAAASMRLDQFLHYARFAKSRSIAAELTRSGTFRLDGRRVERAHVPVRVGCVLAFVRGDALRVVRIIRLPERRGPAAEAATLYIDLCPVDASPPGQ